MRLGKQMPSEGLSDGILAFFCGFPQNAGCL
ncbi:hypothetical protein N872_08460 [Neisseria meningitidis LNP27256]|nr:hypothetical protein N872_08460 [Neisseria meningitidis LNP27256]